MAEIERKRKVEIQANSNYKGIIDGSKELKINNKYNNQLSNLDLKMNTDNSKAFFELEKIENQISQNKLKQEE